MTQTEARKFAKRNMFKSSKIDTTKNFQRLRQRPPNEFKRGTLRTVRLRKNVQAVVGVPRLN